MSAEVVWTRAFTPILNTTIYAFAADVDTFLRDPHGRIVIDDGRRFLKRTGETFDVFTIDSPPPGD